MKTYTVFLIKIWKEVSKRRECSYAKKPTYAQEKKKDNPCLKMIPGLFHYLLFWTGKHTFFFISANCSEWKINALSGSSSKSFKVMSGVSSWVSGVYLVGTTCRRGFHLCYVLFSASCSAHSGCMLAFRERLDVKCNYFILLVRVFQPFFAKRSVLQKVYFLDN